MVLAVAPRLVVGLTGGEEVAPQGERVWEDTHLRLLPSDTGQNYRNLYTGEIVRSVPLPGGGYGLRMASVLANFPVAMLERM